MTNDEAAKLQSGDLVTVKLVNGTHPAVVEKVHVIHEIPSKPQNVSPNVWGVLTRFPSGVRACVSPEFISGATETDT